MTNAHVDAALQYAKEHGETFRAELRDLIRIPCISTLPEHNEDLRRAADWVANSMKAAGLENVAVMETGGHPVVYADWLHAEGAPTILVYGHYDVQPADKEEDGWTYDPFEPIEVDGKIYARGSSDDKGQMYAHIKAAEAFLKTGALPVNLKFMIEGEEERGSKNLSAFVKANTELLKADACVISDTGMDSMDEPVICYSVRGLTYMQLDIQGPKEDLHSGGFGGAVHNPALALAQMISKFHNADNSVAVPGFYDDVLPLSDEERAEIKKTEMTEADLKNLTGITSPWGEEGYSITERIGGRPTLEINGLLSGFTGVGGKTVLPAKAMAKISCRLVGNQDPIKIYELIKAYVAEITPPGIHAELQLLDAAEAVVIDYSNEYIQAAVRAYAKGWGGKPAVFKRGGGTLPVVADLRKVLNLPVVLMGFGLPTDGAHGPDEHYHIERFHKGIDTTINFYNEVTQK